MKRRIPGWIVFAAICAMLAATGYGQSTEQMFPTPVVTSEIGGTIAARDIGDARLTTYFYTFEGGQGDLFINIQAKNYTGDIDLYAKDGLRPLTKIVIYPDTAETETGRVIYLRKPEVIILRIQGRAQGDDDAKFVIKFAGGFIASREKGPERPDLPKVDENVTGSVRVNSVGTRLPEPKPSATPAAAAIDEQKVEDRTEKVADERVAENDKPAVDDAASKKADVVKKATEKPKRRANDVPRVIVTDSTVAKVDETRTEEAPKPAKAKRPPRRSAAGRRTVKVEKPKPPEEKVETAKKDEERVEKAKEVDPMASVRLVVYFRDGSKVDRPMSEVLRFSVERAILTVISKDGSIGRYNMIDVKKVSIE